MIVVVLAELTLDEDAKPNLNLPFPCLLLSFRLVQHAATQQRYESNELMTS
jgi:hypothetical protein